MSSRAFLSACLVLFVCSTALADPSGYADKPAPTDFRGLAFGAEVKDLPGLIPVPGQRDTYQRKDESLDFGAGRLISVAYYADKGRLTGVGLAVAGEANIFLVQEQLIRAFGPGVQRGDQYGWVWRDFSVVLRRVNKDRAAVYYTLERAER